ncbi:hypothetical protein NLJ89_g8412 [Agrocybe chaxingu]|uniref:F-box domain-containing protein n=1 Tax=Agrocybe chaxingu TaxID=84603 RepID=A0A9W8JVH7_9AGAR|nr:hypothetical protein NLJ89_g8412 [Agrocybe chaxingu]
MADIRGADIYAQRSVLQREEARLSAALSSIRSQLNALVPVSSLPAEILEEIFERIDLCDARFADTCLLRSKQAPLSIVSTSPLKLTTDSNRLTLHAARLRSIDVFLFPDDMLSLFVSTGRILPSLERLSLRVLPASPLSLDLSVPHVRRLFLDCVAVRWESCQNLTHLSLHGLDADMCPSIYQLHTIFSASPNLACIRLENVLPNIEDAPTPQPVALSRLKEMIISSKPSIVRSILAGVFLGPNTRLQLYLSLSEDLYTLFPHGLPYLTQRHNVTSPLPPAPDLDVHTVRLSRHGANFLRCPSPDKRRENTTLPTSAWVEDASQMIFTLSSASSVGTRICSSLDYLLDLSHVRALEVNTGVLLDIPMKALRVLFSDLMNLDTLRVAFNDLEDLLNLLQAVDGAAEANDGPASENSDPAPGQLYLPCLSTLSFSKPSDLWWHFGERWISPILKCVESRRIHSAPIQTLQFFRCHGITLTSVKALEDVVPRVIISEQLGRRSSL